jgi:hypothetical protein
MTCFYRGLSADEWLKLAINFLADDFESVQRTKLFITLYPVDSVPFLADLVAREITLEQYHTVLDRLV